MTAKTLVEWPAFLAEQRIKLHSCFLAALMQPLPVSKPVLVAVLGDIFCNDLL
jgi:hypothetical protein